MNRDRALRFVAGLAAPLVSIVMTGCGTTQASLDQANNGAALTATLQQELGMFRAAQARVAEERIRSLRSLQSMMADYEVASAFDQRVMEAAGNNEAASTMATLRRLADSMAKDEKDLLAKQAAVNESLSKLLSPVPQQAAQLKATQDALALLGHAQSDEEKLQALSVFAKGLKEEIEKAKKAAKDAATTQPTTSAPPGKPK